MASLNQINWTSEYDGFSVTVGNIDGYPSVDHPDLLGKVTVNNIKNVSFNPNSWNAKHSTGVAGLELSVAKDTNIINIPIWTELDKSVYTTEYSRTSLLNSAYKYFVSRNVKCVNRELNSAKSPWGMEAIWGTNDLDLVAKYPEMVHVQPIGNQGLPVGNQVYYKAASTLSHLLIVVGVDSNNKIWSGSNFPDGRALYIPDVRPIPEENYLKNFVVCAPCVSIECPSSPTGTWKPSGTSFASPFVAGLVAKMYDKASQLNVSLTPSECCDIIKRTCTPLGPSETYGHGIINCQAALAEIKSSTPVPELEPEPIPEQVYTITVNRTVSSGEVNISGEISGEQAVPFSVVIPDGQTEVTITKRI